MISKYRGDGAGTIKDIDFDGPFYSKKICINNYLGKLKSAEMSGKLKDLEVKVSGGRIAMKATNSETSVAYAYSVRCKSVEIK